MVLPGSAFIVRAGVFHRVALVLHLVAAVLAAIHLVTAVMATVLVFAPLSFVLGVPGVLVGCGSALRNGRRGDNERKSAKKLFHFNSPNVWKGEEKLRRTSEEVLRLPVRDRH
jgi:4-hydroxybenzoate polyprenyltransferase